MILQNDLTRGPLFPKMMRFAIPYLAACFLQTFYGMADLFITGQYYGAAPVTGVSIGSQVMHMIIVMIAGLTIGSAVSIARKMKKKLSASWEALPPFSSPSPLYSLDFSFSPCPSFYSCCRHHRKHWKIPEPT